MKWMLDKVSGMKVLIVDQETIGMVSMVLTQTQILEKEVFLVERIDTVGNPPSGEVPTRMKHLKAVCFLRPSAQNFILLSKELKEPRYSDYHICKFMVCNY